MSSTSIEERHHPTHEPSAPAASRDLAVGWIAAAVLVAMVAAFFLTTIRRDGDFTYPLDDSYIHLRLGANLAHGTLGMNPGEFASASSSPIWPVLIAGVALFTGPLVGIPLALATLAGATTLVLLDRWARRRGHSVNERAALMAGMVLVVPLVTTALNGMEHVLQAGGVVLLTVVTLDALDRSLRRSPGDTDLRSDRRSDLMILGAAMLCAATRLEAVFLVVPLAVLLLRHRRWRTLAALCVGAMVPVLVVAAVNLGQGWPALPASVLIKAGGVDRSQVPARLLFLQTRLLVVMALTLGLCWYGRRLLGDRWPRIATWWTAVALSASLLNITLGLIAQLYRYEAYLVAVCIVACSVSAHALLAARRDGTWTAPAPPAARILPAVVAVIAVIFGLATVAQVSNAVQEIHLQQAQMARFAASACPGCTVVVNDIGLVSQHGDVRIVDSFGLAQREVVRAKQAGTYDSSTMDSIAVAEGASFAMVYPHWEPAPPERWERVGSWILPDPRVVGGAEVAFYSLDPSRTEELRRAFLAFATPPEVTVTVEP